MCLAVLSWAGRLQEEGLPAAEDEPLEKRRMVLLEVYENRQVGYHAGLFLSLFTGLEPCEAQTDWEKMTTSAWKMKILKDSI